MKPEHVQILLASFVRNGFATDENAVRSAHGGFRFSETELSESSLSSLVEDLVRHRAKIHFTFVEGDVEMRQAYLDADAAVRAVLEALETILAVGSSSA